MPNGEFVDYYELLAVDRFAETKQIRTSFLKLAKDHHPDAGGSTEMMQLLNQAYETLSGHLSRSAYDKLHALHTTPHEELDLHDDFADSPVRPRGNDAFVDDFVDDAYSAYYGDPVVKKPSGKFKKAVFSLFGVSAVTGVVFVLGLMAYASYDAPTAVATADDTTAPVPTVSPIGEVNTVTTPLAESTIQQELPLETIVDTASEEAIDTTGAESNTTTDEDSLSVSGAEELTETDTQDSAEYNDFRREFRRYFR